MKRKGLPIKTNHINSAKHDSYSDYTFDISSKNQQPNKDLDLEGLQNLRSQYHSNQLIGNLKKFASTQNRFIKRNIKEIIIRNN